MTHIEIIGWIAVALLAIMLIAITFVHGVVL